MPKSLDGKVAIVTGASRGIGAAIATRFAAEGAQVLITARTIEEGPKIPGSLSKTAERIRAMGGQCAIVAADLTNADDRQRIIASALEKFGKVDILVNNAAWGRFGPAHKFALHHVRMAFEVNSVAPLDLARAVIPGMIERGGGWILNISSKTSEHPGAAPYSASERYVRFHQDVGPTLYGASKAAQERLTTGMAVELAAHNIAVNSLAPDEAVASEGALAADIGVDMKFEPVEAMAEAALLLCSRPASELSGRIAISLALLKELNATVRSLDGARDLAASGK